MELVITDEKRISEVQKEFSERFPYLKIEFFSKSHADGEASPLSQLLPSDKTVGEARSRHNEGKLVITAHTSVGAMEARFRDVFGLSVQVFRKAGRTWLQTSITDHWTLAEQNEEGREASEKKELN